jgi:transketolase
MQKKSIEAVAVSIRTLTIDAVQKADSGHPGLPMGLAELGALIYGELLKHFPQDPAWINRDRFVLSAGHGAMWQYSLLHLSGYDISLNDLKNFRQLKSKAAGHPEYGIVPGVDTTTGPLGQGFANGVGMAIAEAMLAARFNTPEQKLIDHMTYVVCGDGCMMEGVTAEAASMAGHMGLGKLVVFYDSNRITIEGSTAIAFSEDVGKRFEAYNWHVQEGDAYDLDGIMKMVAQAKAAKDKPSLIVLRSTIAKGSASMEGSHEAHGAPLGKEEVKATKKKLGVPEDVDFYIHPDAAPYFKERQIAWEKVYTDWQNLYKTWQTKNPELYQEWQKYFNAPKITAQSFAEFKVGEKVATRNAGGKVLNNLAKVIPNLVGGSADLAPSNKTYLSSLGDINKENFKARNFHFGVREHGMGSVVNGIILHGGFRPFCSTFFVFADYMRPSLRLAAIMKQPVIYVFTHDSIYVGEDGPTHQPVEHLASLRALPNFVVLRPADAQETNLAWQIALERTTGPSAVILTRQNLEVFIKADTQWQENIKKGAYIAKDSVGEPSLVIVATGSEVELALQTVQELKDDSIRVISMISRELFLSQPKDYQEKLIPQRTKRLVIECGISQGWEGIAGDGALLTINRFGESGPYKELAAHFGFTVDNVIKTIKTIKR